ncbi:MAG: hypothetical protein ACYTDV_11450 [Planctomycetota bacterium]
MCGDVAGIFVSRTGLPYQALSEDSIVGPRASGLSPDKDGEAGDIGCIVDGAPDVHRDSQAGNKPLEVRSSLRTEPGVDLHRAGFF